jgi:diguanylate cyclase (GGDEF)-like protein
VTDGKPKNRERYSSEAAALLEAAASISSKLEVGEVAEEAARQIVAALGVDACMLSKWDQDTDTITMWAEHTRSGAKMLSDWRQPSNLTKYPLAQEVLHSGKALQMRADDPDADKLMRKFLERMGAKIIYILPLVAKERVIGLIEILVNQEVKEISKQELSMRLLANHAGIGIERARLLKFAEQRATDLEALRQASLNLTASLDLQDVLDAILKSILGLARDSLAAHIFLYNDKLLTFGAALWADGSKDKVWANPREDGLTYTVARSGEMMVVSDIQAHPIYTGGPKEWSGSIIGMPLKIGKRVVGVLNIAYENPRNFTPDELRVIGLLADQAALAVENAHLHDLVSKQALTDPLTGLPNRRAFDQRLGEEIRRSIRYQHKFGLVMIDFDDFKYINDTFGHPVGDETLKILGACMQNNVRDTDFVARIGGDEFALVLPETTRNNADKICNQLRKAIAECSFEWQSEDSVVLNPSTGIASFPIDATNGEDLVAAADNALYKTKKRQLQ